MSQDQPRDVGRRHLLAGLGGAAVGAAATLGAEDAAASHGTPGHLPFYGGYASGIRPDEKRPTSPGTSIHWSGPTTRRQVALTFDDGPAPQWTTEALRVLERRGVPATWFLQGRNVVRHGGIHAESIARGHELGNHSWDHPDLATLDYAAVTDQLVRCSDVIERTYGRRPALFRPPYGHLGGSALLASSEQRMSVVLWSAQMHEDPYVSHPVGLVDDLRRQVGPGSIVLAHDCGNARRHVTIAMLDRIVGMLQDQGLTLVTVSDLLRP